MQKIRKQVLLDHRDADKLAVLCNRLKVKESALLREAWKRYIAQTEGNS